LDKHVLILYIILVYFDEVKFFKNVFILSRLFMQQRGVPDQE